MLPSANADAPTSLSNLLLFGPHRIGESTYEVESIYPRARTAWKEGRRPRLPPVSQRPSPPQPPLLSTRRCRNASTYPWKKLPNGLELFGRLTARSGYREVGGGVPAKKSAERTSRSQHFSLRLRPAPLKPAMPSYPRNCLRCGVRTDTPEESRRRRGGTRPRFVARITNHLHVLACLTRDPLRPGWDDAITTPSTVSSRYDTP